MYSLLMLQPTDRFDPLGFPIAIYNAKVPKAFSDTVLVNSGTEYSLMVDALRGVLSDSTALVVKRGYNREEIWNFRSTEATLKTLMEMSEMRDKIVSYPDKFFDRIVERGVLAHINIYNKWRANDVKDLFVIHIKYDPTMFGGTFSFEFSCNSITLAARSR